MSYSFYCSRCKFDHPGECKTTKAEVYDSVPLDLQPTMPGKQLGPNPKLTIRPTGPNRGTGQVFSTLHTDVYEVPDPSQLLWSRFLPPKPLPHNPGPGLPPWQIGAIIVVHCPCQGTSKLVFRVMEASSYPMVEILAANGTMVADVGAQWRIARDSYYGEYSKVAVP